MAIICPVLDLTQQLIRCPSVTPNDAGCQDIIIKRLETMNFNIERMHFDTVSNFWAWRGVGKTLVFLGHTDVVCANQSNWITKPFEPSIRNGILFGRGAADMKGALAAMVVAAERFILSYPNYHGRLAFLITSDEEGDAVNGTAKVIKKLVTRNEQLDYCLVGEPTSLKFIGDTIKNGRRGSITAYITIYGTQSHVAYSTNNPIHLMIPFVSELRHTLWDKGNKIFSPTSMQVISINTESENYNTVPRAVRLQINFRFSTELTDSQIRYQLESILRKHAASYKITWKLFGQPFYTNTGSLLNSIINSVIHYTNNKPILSTDGGTSDGRFIACTGAQVVELGPVNSTIHKANECVRASDLQVLSRMYQRVLIQLLS